MSRRTRPRVAGADSVHTPRQRRGHPSAQCFDVIIPERPPLTRQMDASGERGVSEPPMLTRTVLPVQGWWRDVEPAPTSLPPGYVAAQRPVVAGPDGDELRVRAWLRRRLGGAV